MDWYSLFVVTGKEENVAELLKIFFSGLEVRVMIPRRRLIERSQGKTRQVLKKMFPGYLLVNMNMNLETYTVIKKIPNLIRVLNSGEYYTKIPPEEMTCICQLLSEDDVVDFSKVYFEDSRIVVKSGPLAGREGLIKSVDRRKLRAKITMQFMGLPKEIDLGIEVLAPIITGNEKRVG